MPNNIFSARDGRIFAFQWAEATFPMGGNKNFANRKKIKRPPLSPGRLKHLQDSKLFRTFAVEKYSCALRQQTRGKKDFWSLRSKLY